MVRELGPSKLYPGAQTYEIAANDMANVIISYLISQKLNVPTEGKFTVVIQRRLGDFIIHLVPKD
jgi:hypothetical protein